MLTDGRKQKCENARQLSKNMPLDTALLLCGVTKSEFQEYLNSKIGDMLPEGFEEILNKFSKG